MARHTRRSSVGTNSGGAAAYVWDYAGGMAMMRYFWDAATAVDPAAAELDEGHRFPLCQPESLRQLWTDAGLDAVADGSIPLTAKAWAVRGTAKR